MEFSIFGLKYVRLIKEIVSQAEIDGLKKQFHYFYISTYQKPAELKGVEVLEKRTSVIDLAKDLTTIFNNFNKTTRNEIRKTEYPNDFQFSFKIPGKDWQTSFQLYKQVKTKDDWVQAEPKKEFKPLTFFNAEQKDKLIVSIACYDTGQILRFKSIVSRRKQAGFSKREMAYASRRLVWEIIKYGKKHQYQKMDFGIVNSTEPKKAGISRFKMCFGGEIKNVYLIRWQDSIFKIVKRLLKLFKINIH